MEHITGGVCAPLGFKAGGIHCGIRKNRVKRDIALIISEVPASASAVYTQNLVKGAPIYVTQRNIADGIAQAAVCNSGNANTCNADGEDVAWQMCQLTAEAAGLKAEEVIVASTGVIGQPLSIEPIRAGMSDLFASVHENGSQEAAEAIMTTDTKLKEVAVSFVAGGKTCKLGGIAKGSGMIHPNLATMLVFLTCDAAIAPAMLKKALADNVQDTFNMTSVDGDTSTNDMVCIMSNGMAGNEMITAEGDDYAAFCAALNEVTTTLCRAIAKDGEGATRLLTCYVKGGKTVKDAKLAAKSVVCSSLFKAAIFGADANWGRVLCALGYSGADIDVKAVDVTFRSIKGSINVCSMGSSVPFSEEKAKEILTEDEIDVLIQLRDGDACATAWGCDLTYDYVKINGDYRT
ncbi:MAG: bifunctional glutamate N-acetyltransferase/amino-acid acetyltransferase ArgJ [Clostridiales bacterium]|nr:bifunctional glutamate N-acetyltransferase/amino-acid acetyltransferase ArgJ [Clostridiales bacterium]